MTSRTQIALVADADAASIDIARRELRRHGMRVVTASSGERALRAAEQQRPDLVILAVALPGIPGLEVLRRLRARGPVPAIMLTEGRTVSKTMRSGDTLRKPFTAEQLTARIHEVMGRNTDPPASRIVSGDVEIDLDHRAVTRDGEAITLTRTEWALLAYLAANPRRLLTGGDILSQVWGPEYREDLQFLRVWVSRLRAKLGGAGSRLLIRTVRGVGYIFDPDAEEEQVEAPRRRARAGSASTA